MDSAIVGGKKRNTELINGKFFLLVVHFFPFSVVILNNSYSPSFSYSYKCSNSHVTRGKKGNNNSKPTDSLNLATEDSLSGSLCIAF